MERFYIINWDLRKINVNKCGSVALMHVKLGGSLKLKWSGITAKAIKIWGFLAYLPWDV